MKSFSGLIVAWLAASALANPIVSDGKSIESKRDSNSRPPPSQFASGQGTSPCGRGQFTFEQLWDLQKKFLDNFMYPANTVQAQMINSTLMADNVKGRVDITRTFDGPELNTEYLFGLFSNLALNPNTVTLLGYPVSYNVTHFAASDNIASAATIIDFHFPAINKTVPLEIDTWNMFNDQGQVLQYDATFRWFQYFFDYLIEVAMDTFKVPTAQKMVEQFQFKIAEGICDNHEKYCRANPQNIQYESRDVCMETLTKQTRFGKAYELGADTLVCRMVVHENMIPARPEVHCPHIGPGGGGKCTDSYSYESKILEPFFTRGPFVPYGYHSKNTTIAAM